MTFPIDIHIGSIFIRSHVFFELLAFFVAYRYYKYLSKSKNTSPLNPNAAWWIIIGMAIGAFLVSRLFAALENPYLFINTTDWIYYIGGQTIAGGVVGGILGLEITKKIFKVKRKTGDLFVYPLILGIIIGRIGCFLTGVTDGTVGLPSNLPWAIDQGDGVLRHPTALYEIVFLILLWIIITNIQNKKILNQGDLFGVFALFYFIYRLLVEFIKPTTPLWIGLSSIQLLSLFVVIYYTTYFIRSYKKT